MHQCDFPYVEIPNPVCQWCLRFGHASMKYMEKAFVDVVSTTAEQYLCVELEKYYYRTHQCYFERDLNRLRAPVTTGGVSLFGTKVVRKVADALFRMFPKTPDFLGVVKTGPPGGCLAEVASPGGRTQRETKVILSIETLNNMKDVGRWEPASRDSIRSVYIEADPSQRYFICTWPTNNTPGLEPGVLLYNLHDRRGREIEEYVYALAPAFRRRLKELFEEALRRLKAAPGQVAEAAHWVLASAAEVRDWIRSHWVLIGAVILAAVILFLVVFVIEWAVVLAFAVWLIRLALLPILASPALRMVP